ncbi:endonuclease/exonuclease/phosphatase family protein [Nocardioides lijunqiniae]|uniref:endonuclease/exonuclease/phosphatase family protein n=1 Tax=Nocardioides lijunqiniae TaxID=2760832 RepID=UPI001877AECD|nr:endonuclease/exonuclease/phosphatase family protein [Nocardioides lijunqiniae]
MRVVTMNIWARHGDWDARRTLLRDTLQQLSPDIVALQETVVTDRYDQVVDLLGTDLHVTHQWRRESDGSGMSLASRWPFVEVVEQDFLVTDRVDPREFAGSLLAARVEAPPPYGALWFASPKPSFRLGHERERELQAVGMAARLEALVRSRGGHVVVAGDFDATPDSASMRFWAGLQSLDGTSVAYRDAWSTRRPDQPGHTFKPDNPLVTGGNWPTENGRRIDYVWVRCGPHGPTLRIDDCDLLLDEPRDGVWASDHCGVVAELTAP